MFKSLRSSAQSDLQSNGTTDDAPIRLQLDQRSIPVTHDGFTIGSGRRCDLNFAEPAIPFLHSVIHRQSGAVWIEAADDAAFLQVNDRTCRRMSLRHGDRLTIGSIGLVIDLGIVQPQLAEESPVEQHHEEDLQSLSAEELCDRIVTEQTMIQELSEVNSGWGALMQAIKAVRVEPMMNEIDEGATFPIPEELVAYDALFGQIQELHETIIDRSRELNQKEAEVLASTSSIS